MKLAEALALCATSDARTGAVARVELATGFTPLHLSTFLRAELAKRLSDRKVEIGEGVFEDLEGTLNAVRDDCIGCVVAVEWPDLDPRLGLRRLGGWSPSDFGDVAEHVVMTAKRLTDAIARVAKRVPVVLVPPTLGLPPISYEAAAALDELTFAVNSAVEDMIRRALFDANVRIANRATLDLVSPTAERRDVRTELSSGWPYTTTHASAVARLVADLVVPAAPKKGLITDLDDTLWKGLLGEDGIDGVRFDLEAGAQVHGLYQQLLSALAETGVLIAVASKNDPELVEALFDQRRLVLAKDRVFPFEVGWFSKAEGVARVLEQWNVAAQDVVFVDDSPLELAEVAHAHPGISCIQFPSHENKVLDLLFDLRAAFAKQKIGQEDRLRVESIRTSATELRAGGRPGESDEVLRGLDATISLSFDKADGDGRAFELVNKTNQFNLNGRRYAADQWRRMLQDESRFLMTISYRDKFGPLGRIGVVSGEVKEHELAIDVWVMSCRAFSRRIEHQSLSSLFERFARDRVSLDYARTDRNEPIRRFLSSLVEVPDAPGAVVVERPRVGPKLPKLFHQVEDAE